MTLDVLEPADARATATLLADAATRGLRLTPRGNSTKAAWADGHEHPTALLSTTRLVDPIEHFAGDLIATLPSGTTLSAANAMLARSGQWLPLDPPHHERATIGGIVATNDSGPRRHRFGSPRDLIVGIELALADGRLVKAGGRVVKNVAGYDLSRLMCGSFGSLAVITSATFKLAPLPPASCTLVAHVPDIAAAVDLGHLIAASPVAPSTIEIEAPTPRLLVRFETTPGAAEHMTAATRALMEHAGCRVDVLTGHSEHDVWQRHDELIWDRPGLVARVSVLPSEAGALFSSLRRVVNDADYSFVGRIAMGVLLLRINTDATAQVEMISALQAALQPGNGHLTLLQAPDAVRGQMAATIHRTPAQTVAEALKAQFDPRGALPPIPGCGSAVV